MKKSTSITLTATLLAAAFVACGGGLAGDNPQIELDPAGTDVQMTTVYSVKVINIGDATLKIPSAPVLAGGLCQDGVTSAFSLEVQAGAEFPYEIEPADNVPEGGNAALELTVRFNDPTDLCSKNATVTILSNDVDTEELVINITKAVVEPNIAVNPNPVDMGFVPLGPTAFEDTMYIQNTGLAPLEISRVDVIKMADGFAFVWPCERKSDAAGTEAWATDKDARIPIAYDPPQSGIRIDDTICASPVVVEPASSVGIPVFYTAISETPARAIFLLYSNDPDYDISRGESYEATLQANYGGPCLLVTPTPIDFGTVVVGSGTEERNVQIYNCGDEELSIHGLYFSEGTSSEFTMDISPATQVSENNPLKVAAGMTTSILVKYTPTDVNKDLTGKLVPDQGFLVFDNNTPRQSLQVPINGLGAEAQCAVCQFSMSTTAGALNDGDTIKPQEEIQFMNHSVDPTFGGSIASCDWTVKQPADSVSVFVPTATVCSDTTFQPNIIGEYEFCLEVFNKDGCSDKCCQTVKVEPPEGCHIELTWNTPADTDQGDECYLSRNCGADMDLHVAHPMASGDFKDTDGTPYGYFDPDFDCYWFITQPVWDMDNASDWDHQPNLDRDDTDGAGPENFTYKKPDPDVSTTPPNCYRVGVHYFDDHLFGKSYPTIRIFVNDSVPVYEKTITEGMNMLDMWDVGRLCCSNAEAPFVERTNQDGSAHIATGYPDETLY